MDVVSVWWFGSHLKPLVPSQIAQLLCDVNFKKQTNKQCVGKLLRRWGWEELEHPPYSPDISPCDFDLICKIKEPLRGRRFATHEDIATAVRQQVARFSHGAAHAAPDGIQRLPHRWQRVVTVAGDYFEGL